MEVRLRSTSYFFLGLLLSGVDLSASTGQLLKKPQPLRYRAQTANHHCHLPVLPKTHKLLNRNPPKSSPPICQNLAPSVTIAGVDPAYRDYSVMIKIAVAATVGALGWAYLALLKPPPPKVCGSPGGPPVTSPRIKLSDGRHLAYRERGVSKEKARYKIIIVHGFDNSKDLELPISQELIEELQIYLLSYDRAGYGESDPYPRRTVKSEAFDIQELADELKIGPKFYVLGMSMGAYVVYSCLKYIPHRLAGASLVVPFVHYWWPRFPPKILKGGLEKHLLHDQRTFRVAHYAPWLFHWWMTQKWVPSLSMLQGNMGVFCPKDLETIKQLMDAPNDNQERARQQGVYESLYKDMIVGFGDWGFSPLDLDNPFPNNEGSVHIWQGEEDRIIPSTINRHISEKLSWIRYHEVPTGGHLIIFDSGLCESIFRTLVEA